MRNTQSPETLLSAIRAKCLDCCAGSRKEVERCKIDYCPLWQYRIREQREHRKEEQGQIDIFDFMMQGGAQG